METSRPEQPTPPSPDDDARPIPPAFYRDDSPPPPPPDDPHRREWPEGVQTEAPPRWIIWAIPGFIALTALIHVLVVLVPLVLHR